MATMPPFEQVDPAAADLAWLVYDLILNEHSNRYELTLVEVVYTQFAYALPTITIPPLTDDNLFRTEIQKRIGISQVAPELAETSILPEAGLMWEDENKPEE